MHPSRRRCENLTDERYACVFTSCRTGASTPNMANLFLREPLDHQNALSLPLLQEGNINELKIDGKCYDEGCPWQVKGNLQLS
jgi:hypothetical protein